MSAAFPESGGTYTFAKKVLSVRAAFSIGWVVWFAFTTFREGLVPEALTTLAPRPHPEDRPRRTRPSLCQPAARVQRAQRRDDDLEPETVISQVNCDVAVLRSSPGWHLSEARRILVPLGGRSEHHVLRARLLGSLSRMGPKEVTFLRILPEDASDQVYERDRSHLLVIARDEAPAASETSLIRSADAAAEIIRAATETDLVVLGLQRLGPRQKVFGDFTLRIARETRCPLIMVSRRG
jgi:basic amino acid/polyamine antiporter, APA family